MNTSTRRMIFVTVLSLILLGGMAQAQRFGGGGKGGGAAGGGGFGGGGPVNPRNWNNQPPQPPDWNFTGEWEEMVRVTDFKHQQKDALRRLLKDLDGANKICDKAAKEANEAEVAAKTDADRESAKKKQEAAKEMRTRVETNARAKAFTEIMTAEQRGVWTGHKLYQYFRKEFEDQSIKLKKEQREKAKIICELAGKNSPTPDVENNKKLLDAVRAELKSKVLTEEQAKSLGEATDTKKPEGGTASAAPEAGKSKPIGAPEKPTGLQPKD